MPNDVPETELAAEEELASGLSLVSPRNQPSARLFERAWAIDQRSLRRMSAEDVLPVGQIVAARGTGSALEMAGGYMAGPVAVIPVSGFIDHRMSFWTWLMGGTAIDGLRAAVREAMADPDAKAIVLNVDSPGGSVDGVTEFAAELRQLRAGPKQIVTVYDTLGASAAFWIGSQTAESVMTPSGEVGSVGVYALHEDDSGALSAAGIKITLISAGEFKTEGNPYEPLTDEARKAMQGQVDTFYGMFVGDVAKGRSVSVDTVAASYGQGRTLLARQAVAAGMVDRIDTLEATVRRLSRPGAAAPARGSAASLPDQPAAIAAASTPAHADPAWNARMARAQTRSPLWKV